MKKILFLSGTKGGTGKTTLLLNTAVLLAYAWRDTTNYPVAIIDLSPNVGTASLILLGDPLLAWGRPSLSDYFTGRLTDPLRTFYMKRWTSDKGVFQVVFTYMTQDISIGRRQLEYLLSVVETRLRPRAVFIDTPPLTASSPVIGLVDYVVPVVTPDVSAIETTKNYVEIVGGRKLKPVLNMYIGEYSVNVLYQMPWEIVVEKTLGEKPHIVPFDKLIQAARQALEVEVLKIKAAESLGVKSIIEYAKYMMSIL
ncbi:MAG: ParA family protein [Pyrobaculum sp.]|jgi:cellulose biosynthesis protein BcsQ